MAEDSSNKHLYEQLIELVDSIEKEYTPSDIVTLDLSNMLEATKEEGNEPPKYSDMLSIIAGLEGTASTKSHGTHPEKPKLQQQIEMQQAGPTVVQPTEAQPPPTEVPKPVEKSREKHLMGAKRELGEAIGRLGEIEAEIKMRNIKTTNLVLPNLSVPDQISELERIIEGLTEKVFDSDHLDVIKQEVNGLNRVVQLERAKEKAAGQREVTDEEKIRDQRLSSALALLEKSQGES
jgi:hypothetical protein